jgi:transcriptional regulator with XRE-family HTH domain
VSIGEGYFMNDFLKLKKLRNEVGMSQKELADKLGVSDTVIVNYENGKKTPSLKRLVQMADILNCNLDEIIDLDKAIESYHDDLIKLGNSNDK